MVQVLRSCKWNTCALWNYDLFKKHVKKFDEICAKNPFGELIVCVDGKPEKTEYKGMEDGLAIAKAISEKPELKYKLLGQGLNWFLENNKEKIAKHRKKLARKNEVLHAFMALRNYSVEDLRKKK